MNKKERLRLLIGAAINLIVFGLAIFCLCNFVGYVIKGNPDNRFRYFTNITTLTAGLIALPNALLLVISAIRGKMIYPVFFSIAKFIGLAMVSLTFFTVLFIIAPLTSYKSMYRNMRFVTHLVIPVLVLVSYFFFEEKTLFMWKISFVGMLPPIIYTIIYGINVALLKTWPDIYKVNEKGIWFVYATLIILFNFVLVQGLYFLKKRIISRQ